MKLESIVAFIAITAAACACGNRNNNQGNATLESEVAPLDSIEIKYAPVLELGSKAPNIVALDTLGQSVNLSGYRENYVVLDFWATWCPDCRNELPDLKAVYEEYKDASINGSPVKFLSVSFDRDEDAWKKMIREEGLDWDQIGIIGTKWHESQVASDYKLGWIPTFYLIGPDGAIIASSIKACRMGEALKTL